MAGFPIRPGRLRRLTPKAVIQEIEALRGRRTGVARHYRRWLSVVFQSRLPGRHAREREKERHQDHDRSCDEDQSIGKQAARRKPPSSILRKSRNRFTAQMMR